MPNGIVVAGTCLALSFGMNTIQPSPQRPPPPTQANPLTADNGDSTAAAPPQGFAAALDKASLKPAKKPATASPADPGTGGSPVPAAGNPVPPAVVALPQVVPTGVASVAVAAATGAAALAAPTATIATSAATNPKPLSAPVLPTAARGVAQSQTPALAPDGKAIAASAAAATSAAASDDAHAVGGADGPVVPAGNGVAVPTQASTTILPVNTPSAGKAVGAAIAAKLPAGSVAGNARVAGANSRDAAAPTADSTVAAAPSDLTAAAASSSSTGVAGAATSAAGMAAAGIGVAAQNSGSDADASTTPAIGTAAPALGPDAATALGAAASATAAAAASAARVITELASTTATDKRARGSVESTSSSAAASADGTPGAAQAMSGYGAASGSDAAAAPTFKVGASVDSNEFGQEVGNHVAAMVSSNLNSAKLSVNPPALGPIEVRIAVQGDHAQVWMVSHSAVTRDALHASTGKLREMLGAQGFGQVSVDISQRSFQDRTPTAQSYERNLSGERNDNPAAASATAPVPRAASAILDAYA